MGILAVIIAVVHANTVVHPYLLADNRHYPFYIFRRTILAYGPARYVAAGVYSGCGWVVFTALQGKGTGVLWAVAWAVAVAGALVGAGLVEFRYFVVGWVVWRLRVGGGEVVWRWAGETAWFAVVNAVTAYLFLHKEFEWPSEVGRVQRFMW